MSEEKKKKGVVVRNRTAEFLTFSYKSNGDEIEVIVHEGTIWLTQKLIGELFLCSTANTNVHLKNIFDTGELSASSVIKDFLITAKDGKSS